VIRSIPTGLACLLILGCSSSPKPTAVPSQSARVAEALPAKAVGVSLTTEKLAEVEPGTYGPVSVSLAEGALALWVSPGQSTRQLRVAALDDTGRRRAAPVVVGQCEADLGLVALKAVTNERQALLVYSTQTDDQSTKVRALLLDGNGLAKTAPIELVTMHAALIWLDVVDTASGPVVLYASGRDDRAEIRAVGLTPTMALRFADREVMSGLRAWQVVKSADGAALAVVTGNEGGRGGQVSLLLLDDQATFVGKPIELSTGGLAELDLDLARVGKSYVLAWSERKRIDASVMVAAVDSAGNVVLPPTAATRPMGEQSLVKLVPPGPLGRAALLWEDLNLPNGRRRLSLSEIDETGKLASNTIYLPCSSQSNQVPEIVATSKGWSILTLDDGIETASGGDDAPVPVYLEFGPGLVPQAKTELKLTEAKGGIPLLVWGLDCHQGCRATAAFDGSPVQIQTVLFGNAAAQPGAAAKANAFVAGDNSRLPRLEQIETLLEVEPLADFAVVRNDSGYQLSYLTYFEATAPLSKLNKPGPDGRTDPLQARVDVLTLSEAFALSSPTTISLRATSQPGVSLATGSLEAPGTAFAWSALDQGQPQLFMTLLGADGKKRSQRMLTRRKGVLDEVTVVPASDGWFAAWLDERGPIAELYGIRVTKTLERRGNEQRISQGTGQVTSLAVLPQDGHLLAVWAEVKKAAQRRQVALYARRLSLSDGSPLSPVTRLVENSGAVKFLSLTRFESGALLSWLEVMQEGNSVDAPGRVRYLRLNEKGAVASPSMGLAEQKLSPVSLALECPGKRCHGVVTADLGGRGELLAFDFDPLVDQVPALVPVMRSLGTVEQNVSPILLGEHLFAVDQVDAERARIMHATLRWR
jgi:hypothetical protein